MGCLEGPVGVVSVVERDDTHIAAAESSTSPLARDTESGEHKAKINNKRGVVAAINNPAGAPVSDAFLCSIFFPRHFYG